MIDTHAHLDFNDFDADRAEVIRRAFSSRLKAIINVGCDLSRSRTSIGLAGKYENIFAAIGVHPNEFSSQKLESKSKSENFFSGKKWLKELEVLAKSDKVVAIGEAGLDYYRTDSDEERSVQKGGFVAQIKLAQKLNLPVIVHCRKAYDDALELITECDPQEKTNFVFHCYGAGVDFTSKVLKRKNIFFSFSGNITYPPRTSVPVEKELFEVIRLIPLERLMLDSDCPFLAPIPYRGKRNEPAYVHHIAEYIRKVKKISAGKIESATDENAIKFFRLNLRK